MCACVGTKEVGTIEVISIAFAAGYMILGDIEHVKVVLYADDGTQIFVTLSQRALL